MTEPAADYAAGTNLPLNPDDWIGLQGAWSDLVQRHPELGLTDSRYASTRFARSRYFGLAEQGAMLRLSNGRYLVHKDRFESAAFAALVEPLWGPGEPRDSRTPKAA